MCVNGTCGAWAAPVGEERGGFEGLGVGNHGLRELRRQRRGIPGRRGRAGFRGGPGLTEGQPRDRCGSVGHEPLQGLHEIGKVLEIPVDAGEPDVGYGIDLLERIHDQFAQGPAGHFPVCQFHELGLDIPSGLLQPAQGDRPLLAGGHDAPKQFLPVEGLPAAVLLDDEDGDFLQPLVAGEAATALETLPPPADGIALPGFAGIHHLVLDVATEWAAHGSRVTQTRRGGPPGSPVPRGTSGVRHRCRSRSGEFR